jgi:glycosyltransferase involved in cell wall biosynthesis
MKVGHFVSLGIGGADRAAYNLAIGLKSIGSAPVIFYSKNSLPTRTADQDPNQPLLNILSLYDKNFEVHQIDEGKDLNEFGLDVLHTHRSGEDHWLLPDLESLNRQFKIVETNFHGKLETPADFRIFPSRALMRWKRIRKSKSNAVIPNAILPPLSTESFRSDLGIDPSSVVLGRLARADNSVFSPSLLRAYKYLRKKVPVSLVWVGASDQAKRWALKLGLNEIHWVDPVRDPELVSKWMNTFDVFCHFNKLGETFGNTVAEAMMHKLPVVSLAGSLVYPQAQREMLDSGPQFHRLGASAVAHLRKLCESDAVRAKLGEANQKLALEQYSPEIVGRQVGDLYARVLSNL